jgi:hypothetical protein
VVGSSITIVDGGVTWGVLFHYENSYGVWFFTDSNLQVYDVVSLFGNVFSDLRHPCTGFPKNMIMDSNQFYDCYYGLDPAKFWTEHQFIAVESIQIVNNKFDGCVSALHIVAHLSGDPVPTSVWNSFIISNNNFSNTPFSDVSIIVSQPNHPIIVSQARPNTINHLVITGNTFQEYASDAIYIDQQGTSVLSGTIISNNSFRTTTGAVYAVNPLSVKGAASPNQFIVMGNIVTDGGGINGGAGTIAAVANRVIYANNATA